MSVKYDIVELSKGHYIKLLKCFSTPLDEAKKDSLIVIIPGNPGIIEFYEYFALQLNKLTKLPVVGVSFTGHLYDEEDQIRSWKALDLNDQVNDKLKYIEYGLLKDADVKSRITDKAKLIFVGHSVGCYTILELLGQFSGEIRERISNAFLLMPTVERMRETPNGTHLTFASRYLFWLVYFLAYVVTILPLSAKKFLVNRFTKYDFHSDENLIDGLRDIILNIGSNYSCMRSCFHMGADEMNKVRAPNLKVIEENLSILTFYYGTTDKWCPFEYYVEMKAFVDDLEENMAPEKRKIKKSPTLVLDDNDIDHAFVVFKNQCDYLANLINDTL